MTQNDVARPAALLLPDAAPVEGPKTDPGPLANHRLGDAFNQEVDDVNVRMRLSHLLHRCEELQRELGKSQMEVALKDELLKQHKAQSERFGDTPRGGSDSYELMRRLQVHMRTHMCAHMCTHMCTHICTHICTHMCTHMCAHM